MESVVVWMRVHSMDTIPHETAHLNACMNEGEFLAPSFQLSCHWDGNIRLATHDNQGIYPLCVSARLCERLSA